MLAHERTQGAALVVVGRHQGREAVGVAQLLGAQVAFALEVGEVLVHGGEGLVSEPLGDLLEVLLLPHVRDVGDHVVPALEEHLGTALFDLANRALEERDVVRHPRQAGEVHRDPLELKRAEKVRVELDPVLDAEVRRELGLEDDDGLAHHQADLGAAEREDVHASVGGDGSQGDAERGGGVGDAGAIHVQVHAMAVRQVRERADGETRVAATPETVTKLIGLGAEVAIEAGAGELARFPDADYKAAGATVLNPVLVLTTL